MFVGITGLDDQKKDHLINIHHRVTELNAVQMIQHVHRNIPTNKMLRRINALQNLW